MTESKLIRVVVVDDHTVVRGGINFFLSTVDDIDLVGEADSGESALTLCDELEPDVVLMDLLMPGLGGVAATRAIRECHPQTRVVALTSYVEDDLIQQVLQAGAAGYLLKDVPPPDLAAAIRDAFAGRTILAAEATDALVRQMTGNHTPDVNTDLTKRELAVLRLMADGSTNKQIAARLSLSANTIRTHVSSILSKLNAANRTEAVRLAIKHQLIPNDDR